MPHLTPGFACTIFSLATLTWKYLMNKLAAEKIASDYYDLGCRLALTKQANFLKGFHKTQNALSGALGGSTATLLLPPHIRELLSKVDGLSGALKKGDLKSLLSTQKQNLADLNSRGVDKMIVLGGENFNRAGTEAAIKKLTNQLDELGPMTASEEFINMLPDRLGVGAGIGIGAGIYKGLGKLDKKLKLY